MPGRQGAGFTLLELVLVMIIVSMGWLALLPKLDIAEQSAFGDASKLTEFVEQARDRARATGVIQRVTLGLGSRLFAWDGRELEISREVLQCRINDRHPSGTSFSFAAYPSGTMDMVRIGLAGGTVMENNCLSGLFDTLKNTTTDAMELQKDAMELQQNAIQPKASP